MSKSNTNIDQKLIDLIHSARKTLKPSEVDVVIYHKNCPDGSGAAWSAYKYLEKGLGKKIFYYGSGHSQEDRIPLDEFKDKNVAVFDFSFSIPFSEKIKSVSKNLLILDHHITAERTYSIENKECSKELNQLAHIYMKNSGAVLAYYYFFPECLSGENKKEIKASSSQSSSSTSTTTTSSTSSSNNSLNNVPLFLQYIEDRDLWNWNLKNAKEFCVSFDMKYGFSFKDYDELDCDYFNNETKMIENKEVNRLIEEGQTIISYRNYLIQRIIKSKASFHDNLCGNKFSAWCVNSPIFQSEMGNILSEKKIESSIDKRIFLRNHPLKDDHDSFKMKPCFAIIFSQMHGRNISISLRSIGDEVDVSEIAQKYGGGGHRNAAGCSFQGTIEQFIDSLK